MRYHVSIGGKERVVEVESKGGSAYEITIDGGTPRSVDAAQVEPEVLSILAGEESQEVLVEHDGDAVRAQIAGTTFEMELVDERRHRLRAAHGGTAAAGPVVIKAPMPGKVVKILVQVGQEVAEQQGLIIIEAMKMENELRSPKAGRVESISIVEGQTVESRADLISVV